MALSEYERFRRAYGAPGQGVSPEFAWQHTQRLQAGQDVMDGKYGKGMPQMFGLTPGPNGTAMAGGGAGGGGSSLGQQYQDAADAANAANENRYQDILKKLADRRQKANGLVEKTLAPGVRKELDRTHNRQIGGRVMNDAARGFFRSGAGMSKTAVADRNDDMTRAEGELAFKQAMLDSQHAKDETDFMERKVEQGPDSKELIGLENQMGSAGGPQFLGNPYGMGGGGGGQVQQQGPNLQQLAAAYNQGGAPQGGFANVYGPRGSTAAQMGSAIIGVSPQGIPIRDQGQGPSGPVVSAQGQGPSARDFGPSPQGTTTPSSGTGMSRSFYGPSGPPPSSTHPRTASGQWAYPASPPLTADVLNGPVQQPITLQQPSPWGPGTTVTSPQPAVAAGSSGAPAPAYTPPTMSQLPSWAKPPAAAPQPVAAPPQPSSVPARLASTGSYGRAPQPAPVPTAQPAVKPIGGLAALVQSLNAPAANSPIGNGPVPLQARPLLIKPSEKPLEHHWGTPGTPEEFDRHWKKDQTERSSRMLATADDYLRSYSNISPELRKSIESEKSRVAAGASPWDLRQLLARVDREAGGKRTRTVAPGDDRVYAEMVRRHSGRVAVVADTERRGAPMSSIKQKIERMGLTDDKDDMYRAVKKPKRKGPSEF